jgi:hypothetical protein
LETGWGSGKRKQSNDVLSSNDVLDVGVRGEERRRGRREK